MSVQFRNNVHVTGSGSTTMVFVHGFGCDQTMWRHLVPAFADRYRIVLYDLVGSGRSDWSAYDRAKYGSLHGHVTDLLEVLDACAAGPTVVVGHSVGASIAGACESLAVGAIRDSAVSSASHASSVK